MTEKLQRRQAFKKNLFPRIQIILEAQGKKRLSQTATENKKAPSAVCASGLAWNKNIVVVAQGWSLQAQGHGVGGAPTSLQLNSGAPCTLCPLLGAKIISS